MLIAMLSQTYSDVMSSAKGEWWLERIRMLITLERSALGAFFLHTNPYKHLGHISSGDDGLVMVLEHVEESSTAADKSDSGSSQSERIQALERAVQDMMTERNQVGRTLLPGQIAHTPPWPNCTLLPGRIAHSSLAELHTRAACRETGQSHLLRPKCSTAEMSSRIGLKRLNGSRISSGTAAPSRKSVAPEVGWRCAGTPTPGRPGGREKGPNFVPRTPGSIFLSVIPVCVFPRLCRFFFFWGGGHMGRGAAFLLISMEEEKSGKHKEAHAYMQCVESEKDCQKKTFLKSRISHRQHEEIERLKKENEIMGACIRCAPCMPLHE